MGLAIRKLFTSSSLPFPHRDRATARSAPGRRFPRAPQGPAQLGHPQAQEVHDGHLADERLRRGDRHLEPGAREQHPVGVARGLRVAHVGDREHRGPGLPGDAHRRQGVGRLAGLGDADDEIALTEDRVAVAELGGDVHVDRDARPLLDGVAPDQAGVERRAARDDDDAVDVAQQRLVERADVVQVHAVGADGAIGDGVGDRIGLVVDLLQHEGVVAGLLRGFLVPLDLLGGPFDRLAIGLGHGHAIGGQGDYLAVVDRQGEAGFVEEGGNRRGDEVLPLADANDQRGFLAGSDQNARRIGMHGDDRVVAAQVAVGLANRFGQVTFVVTVDQVGDHFGVRLGSEGDTLLLKPALQANVVFDDPVEDDLDLAGLVTVGMGVGLCDPPVGRPAGVGDSGEVTFGVRFTGR